MRWLSHHGIKGQKWGIRRYQNEDGTWTEAGKRRRNYGYEVNDDDLNVVKTVKKLNRKYKKYDVEQKESIKSYFGDINPNKDFIVKKRYEA